MTAATMDVTAAPGYDEFARAIVEAARRPLPAEAARAARRTLFNVMATAHAAGRTPSVARLATHLNRQPGDVPGMPGDDRHLTDENAALLTGFAAHFDDFDDTHLPTVIHPGAASLGSVWASTAGRAFDGRTLLTAFALGCEVQLRIGLAVSPNHYDRGWHITGTCGVFGAAVAAAVADGADAHTVTDALRRASVQTLGVREAFGTDLKPLHAGLAARNGLRSARIAIDGAAPTSASCDPDLLVEAFAPDGPRTPISTDFTSHWELTDNAFKPYPCGIVAHPGIDAAVDVHRRLGGAWHRVEHVRYHCHPLVPELMGRRDPIDGLQARFSAVHGVAAGLRHGHVGLHHYTDAAANDPDVVRLRNRIELRTDPDVARDAAKLTVTLDSGGIRSSIDHARGSAARPLSDDDLRRKAAGLLRTADPDADAARLWEFVDGLDDGPVYWPHLARTGVGGDRDD